MKGLTKVGTKDTYFHTSVFCLIDTCISGVFDLDALPDKDKQLRRYILNMVRFGHPSFIPSSKQVKGYDLLYS